MCVRHVVISGSCAADAAFEFLTYQLPTVGRWPTVARTGDGDLF